MPHMANVAYDVNYVKAWAWHRHYEKCPREEDGRVLQGNFAYASAARRRTCGGGDGDGGGRRSRRLIASPSDRTHLCECPRGPIAAISSAEISMRR